MTSVSYSHWLVIANTIEKVKTRKNSGNFTLPASNKLPICLVKSARLAAKKQSQAHPARKVRFQNRTINLLAPHEFSGRIHISPHPV